jgi:mannan endo-1,4-beta-mannosidase
LILALATITSCRLDPPRRSGVPTADANATDETKALFIRLWTVGKSNMTLIGHQDDTYFGVGWRDIAGRSDILEVSGSYPAVYGWDVGGIELGGPDNPDGVPFNTIRDRIIEAYRRGGVITISWHMLHPVNFPLHGSDPAMPLIGTAWDVDPTAPAVSAILPGGVNHAIYRQWLDQFAAFDRSLTVSGVPWNQNEHLIPVIFRPFHEHNGSVFWWGGRNTTEADYIALWRFTVEYLRDTAGLHNLLYAYSPDARFMFGRGSGYIFPDLAAFQRDYFYAYPGDDYVDVLGLDYYGSFIARGQDVDEPAVLKNSLDMLVQTADSRNNLKIPALTELGGQRWPDPDWWTTYLYPAMVPGHGQVAWALLWRNSAEDSRSGPYRNASGASSDADDFVVFKNRRSIILENEIPFPLYSWPFVEPFTGIWRGPDPIDGSEITMVLTQTRNSLTGMFVDTYSEGIPPPGYQGSGAGEAFSDTTAEMTFDLTRSDGSIVHPVMTITLSNGNNTLTFEIEGFSPTILERQ